MLASQHQQLQQGAAVSVAQLQQNFANQLRAQKDQFQLIVDNLKNKPGEREQEQRSLTTSRAFSLLPQYSGKLEEFENWRFQVSQFLSEDPFSSLF